MCWGSVEATGQGWGGQGKCKEGGGRSDSGCQSQPFWAWIPVLPQTSYVRCSTTWGLCFLTYKIRLVIKPTSLHCFER